MSIVKVECTEGVPLSGARGAKDLGPEMASDLGSGHADAPSGSVNEDALAALEVSDVDQAVVGGEKDDRDGCGLDE